MGGLCHYIKHVWECVCVFVLPFKPNVPEIDGCSPVNFFGVFCFLPGSNEKNNNKRSNISITEQRAAFMVHSFMTTCSDKQQHSWASAASYSLIMMLKSQRTKAPAVSHARFLCWRNWHGFMNQSWSRERICFVSLYACMWLMVILCHTNTAFLLTFQTWTHTHTHTLSSPLAPA